MAGTAEVKRQCYQLGAEPQSWHRLYILPWYPEGAAEHRSSQTDRGTERQKGLEPSTVHSINVLRVRAVVDEYWNMFVGSYKQSEIEPPLRAAVCARVYSSLRRKLILGTLKLGTIIAKPTVNVSRLVMPSCSRISSHSNLYGSTIDTR